MSALRPSEVAPAVGAVARVTPVVSSRALSERAGGTVVLKAESLQRTGSFKLRGALAKIAALGDGAPSGLICGSAGNHAQAVAYAARARGIRCEVVMPRNAPVTKVEAVRGLGATVHAGSHVVDECIAEAEERAVAGGLTFVHPFDDPAVIAGQGTLGLELADQCPALARVVVPLGGGGLAAGIALALAERRPDVALVGVQAAACAPWPHALGRAPAPGREPGGPTLADGVAVKVPGARTLAVLEDRLSDVLTVDEEQIGGAMMWLLERARLVVEGAGAVGVAALLAGALGPETDGDTVVVLSGGNVDVGVLASVARHHETLAGRRLVLFTRVPDQPGELAHLLERIAATGANLVDVGHVREGVELHVGESAVQLVLETRGAGHAEQVRDAVRDGGYVVDVMS